MGEEEVQGDDMFTAKILIVEDEVLIALDIKTRLGNLGYSITGVVRAAAEGLCRVAEDRPDLVLMDIRIAGEIDGIDFARQLVDEYGIAVVFLTAHSDEATLDRARRVGPFGYVVKPFHERALATAVEIALDRHRDQERLREQREWLAYATAFYNLLSDQRDTDVLPRAV
jgi:CheY-like chemotaxis protein